MALYQELIDLLDKLFLATGIIFLFLGFAGIVLVVTTYGVGMFRDEAFTLGFAFVNGFMTVLGIFLVFFHDKIIVKSVKPF